MRTAPLLGAALSLGLVVGSGCAGNQEESEADIKAELEDALRESRPDLDADAADCFAELVIDEVGLDELRDVDLSAEIPKELEGKVAQAAVTFVDECEGSR